jgi:hypothetical protein
MKNRHSENNGISGSYPGEFWKILSSAGPVYGEHGHIVSCRSDVDKRK